MSNDVHYKYVITTKGASDMTKVQVERWYRKLWNAMTKGDGYQPWGYDLPTLRMTHPGFLVARARLKVLWCVAT